jgi:ferredoxin
MSEDGKSSLKGAKAKPKTQIEELTVKKLNCSQDAADSCPVEAININS